MKHILSILVCLLTAAVQAHAVYFRHIGTREGLSQLSVLSIHQDRLGRMWFGTAEGLSIYDGTRVMSYKPANNPYAERFATGNLTEYIVEDRHGNVFFNADNALYRYDLQRQESACILNKDVHALYSQGGEIWLNRKDSICRLDAETCQLEHFCLLPPQASYATALCRDASGRLWIGTMNGLYIKGQDSPLKCLIEDTKIFHIFADSKQNVWVSTATDGLYQYTAQGEKRHYTHRAGQLASNEVRSVGEDNEGNIWIGTFLGLYRYNPTDGNWTCYTKNGLPGSISHSSVFPIYKDRQGTLWIGTYYGGVNYFNPDTDLFHYFPAQADNERALSFPFVGHMVEDKSGNVYICTEGGGLNYYDKKHRKFTHYLRNEHKNSIAQNNLKAIAYDEKADKLYIGTHLGGISIYDIGRRTFRNPMLEHPELMKRCGDRATGMALYGDELIFTNTTGNWKMNTHTLQVRPLFASGKHYGFSTLLIDRQGYIWMATKAGIYRINLSDEHDRQFHRLNQKGLGDQLIISMLEDRQGNIWMGTAGAGLYRYQAETDTFTAYTTRNSRIGGDYCYYLAQTRQGRILISGNKGLTLLDADTGEMRTIEVESAMPQAGFNEGCGLLVSSDGEIFVGSVNGLFTFHEQQLLTPAKEYQLYFAELFINNRFTQPGDGSGVLQKAFWHTDLIRLDHEQNNLVIHFRSNNYTAPLEHPVYEYRLYGYDQQWISTDNNEIHYTNISPGSYTLQVRERGKQEVAPIEIKIEVRPPFYASPLSYALYLLTVAAVIISIFRFKQQQYRLRTSLQMEKQEKARIEELNQAKLQFFANISHEFRTPLTIVISQLDLLLQDVKLPARQRNLVMKAYSNSHHLRSLISELLDFRKLEQGHVKLQVSEYDLVPFLQNIYTTFADYAGMRTVDYRFEPKEASIPCWFDPKQLEKVVYNLLSNAFKYTPKGGSILLSACTTAEGIDIRVTDNGVGIRKEDIDRIFDRFYQAGNAIADIVRSPSSGIGLALVKHIVTLHRGTVRVESTPGSGSTFIVSLQKGNSHYTEAELEEKSVETGMVWSGGTAYTEMRPAMLPMEAESTDEEGETEEPGRHRILIVEDNEELLHTLEALFRPFYRTLLARNGREGLEKARTEMPDIIVSDVMMPEMDGLEMCAQVKNHFDLCHIPVVLLTALTAVEHSIKGLGQGADDYISKPFNAQVLLMRCNNLINNRHILQKKFQREECDPHLLATNALDQDFLDKTNAIIERNLDNPDFAVDHIASEIGLSRTAFYAKFKALAGMTPLDFILNFKLKRAAHLLRTRPDLQIADITYQLGFSSPRYFSKCFKTLYEITPTEYRKQNVDKIAPLQDEKGTSDTPSAQS